MDALGFKGWDLPCCGSIRSRAPGKFISCQPDSRLLGCTRADLVGCGLQQVPKVSAWYLASSPVTAVLQPPGCKAVSSRHRNWGRGRFQD